MELCIIFLLGFFVIIDTGWCSRHNVLFSGTLRLSCGHYSVVIHLEFEYLNFESWQLSSRESAISWFAWISSDKTQQLMIFINKYIYPHCAYPNFHHKHYVWPRFPESQTSNLNNWRGHNSWAYLSKFVLQRLALFSWSMQPSYNSTCTSL